MKKITDTKIGILGGGQLGRMLAIESSAMGLHLSFLDAKADYPAMQISEYYEIGNFNDFDDVYNFGKTKDVVSIEIENVNIEALARLEEEHIKVIPSSRIISIIKDKGLQKKFYQDHGLPTSQFKLLQDKNEIISALEAGIIHLPFVQKSRTEGYDGKGVQIIKKEDELSQLMDGPCVIERLVPIKKELAIIIARNESNEVQFFDPVEMVFDAQANLLDYLLCPAEIDSTKAQELKDIALKLVTQLDYVGLLAIEFFLDIENNVIINEVAPRTHNSGHHTIDACHNSQFNVQLRTLLNIGLGDSQLAYKYAGIVNIVGEENCLPGPVRYEGLEKALSLSGVYVHIYGKKTVKPFRKMGHINICTNSIEELLEKISIIKKSVKATS